MRGRLVLLGMATWLAVLACGTPKLRLPQVSDVELATEFDAFGGELVDTLIDQRVRLRNIEYALATAAARHCGELGRPRAGAILGRADSFEGDELRALAAQTHGLGEAPSVVHLVPAGSFERAGIRTGDVVLRVGEVEIDSGGDLEQSLLGLGPHSTVRVVIQRDGREQTLEVALDTACPVFAALADSPLIVPWQHERLIVDVPLGLLRFTPSDDVLAVAMAHQFAHELFEQPGEDTVASEARADELGVMLAADAGYDVSVAPAYWEDVAEEYPWLIGSRDAARVWRRKNHSPIHFGRYPHPEIARRMSGIRAAARRYQARATSHARSP